MVFNKSVLDNFIDEEVGMVIDEIVHVDNNSSILAISPTGELDVDISKVYGELNNLVVTAKDLLDTASFIMTNDTTGESIAGVASMINTVRQLVKEFSSIHTQNLKFEQQKEMEMLKQANREKLIRMRNPIEVDEIEGDVIPLREYSQEDMVKRIIEMRQVK